MEMTRWTFLVTTFRASVANSGIFQGFPEWGAIGLALQHRFLLYNLP